MSEKTLDIETVDLGELAAFIKQASSVYVERLAKLAGIEDFEFEPSSNDQRTSGRISFRAKTVKGLLEFECFDLPEMTTAEAFLDGNQLDDEDFMLDGDLMFRDRADSESALRETAESVLAWADER